MKKTLSKTLLLVPMVFFLMHLAMMDRGSRFEDENTALIDGYKTMHALLTQNPAIQKDAATFNATNGIGMPLAVIGAGLERMFGDILAPRLYMALWAFAFWLSLALFFTGLARFLGKPVLNSSKRDLDFKTLGLVALFTAFVQSVPFSIEHQTLVLSEFPGLTCVFLALTAWFSQRYGVMILFSGLAACMKLNFLLYAPLFVFIYAFQSRLSFKKLIKGSAFYLLPLLAIQVFKLAAYGPHTYFEAYRYFLVWFSKSSGSGIQHGAWLEVNEWPSYTHREKFYYLAGSFMPLLALGYMSLKKWIKNTRTLLPFLLFAGLVLFGSFHWFYLAEIKWWRRSFYFIVPGYAFGMGVFLIQLREWLTQKKRFAKPLLVFVICLASYVLLRHTLWGYLEHHPRMPRSQRQFFDWENPRNNGS